MAKRRTVSEDQSIASLRPDLMEYWDDERNTADPRELSPDSRTSVHWRCPNDRGHRWMALVKNMAADCNCPGCVAGADRRRSVKAPARDALLSVVNEDVAAEWYGPYNGDVTPDDVPYGSHLRFWWKCSKHGVIWESAVYDRTSGKGCPKCRSEKIGKARSTLKPGDSLAEKYPDMTAEWDILLNDTTPDKVFAHGRDIVHWVCGNPDCRYRWSSYVCNRTCNDSGCPKCGAATTAEKGRVPKPGHSLAEMYPLIADELVVSEHGETDPSNIAYSSGAVCTWKCSMCGETTWDASVNSRTAKGVDVPGCKHCAAKRTGKANMRPRGGVYLKDGAKDIAAEWDEKRNRDELGLEIDDIALHSNLDAYWVCPNCGESYLTTVNKRTTRGDGCTKCDYHAKSSFPEKAILYYVKMAYPDAVGNASPDLVGLGRKEFDVWIPSTMSAVEYDGQRWHGDEDRDLHKEWVCFENGIRLVRVREPKCPIYQHIVPTVVIDRDPNGGYRSLDEAIRSVLYHLGCKDDIDVDTLRDEGAIRSAMQLEFVNNSIAVTHPEIAKTWCDELNGDLRPTMFSACSSRDVYWRCEHGHEPYKQEIRNRVRAAYNGCPKCNAERTALRMSTPKDGESLLDKHPEIADLWNNEMNGDVTPADVKPGSGFVAYWDCPNHDEPFDMPVVDKVSGGVKCCPYCSNKRLLPGFNDVASVRPDLIDEWDDDANGDMTPYNTIAGSHKTAAWICSDPDCENRWMASVASRVRGAGCHRCAGKKISIAKMRPKEGESLLDLYPELAAEWSDGNGWLKPSMVRPKSGKVVEWECGYCGENWMQAIAKRTKSGECGCKKCQKERRGKMLRRPRDGMSLIDTNPVLAAYWDDDANGGIAASDVYEKNGVPCSWRCPTCGDTWIATGCLMSLRKYPCKKCRREHRCTT